MTKANKYFKKPALNGFEIQHPIVWNDCPNWQFTTPKGKHYIVFRFTDDKQLFLADHGLLKIKNITQPRAIRLVIKYKLATPQVIKNIQDVGKHSQWWRDGWDK